MNVEDRMTKRGNPRHSASSFVILRVRHFSRPLRSGLTFFHSSFLATLMPSNILLCLDTDPQPSVFDGVVAVDAGIDHLFRHGGVTPDDVRDLVHGAMFTRGGKSLKHTAVFIGGSDVQAGEQLLAAAQQAFFGPVRVSLMLDSNGSNTTAAAAVVAARKHLPFGPETTATILGGTGPVGQRVVRMLAQEGVEVRVASRRISRFIKHFKKMFVTEIG